MKGTKRRLVLVLLMASAAFATLTCLVARAAWFNLVKTSTTPRIFREAAREAEEACEVKTTNHVVYIVNSLIVCG